MADRDHPGEHDTDCWCATYTDSGYEFCRAHEEWHRPPECPVNSAGEPAPWWEHLDIEPLGDDEIARMAAAFKIAMPDGPG